MTDLQPKILCHNGCPFVSYIEDDLSEIALFKDLSCFLSLQHAYQTTILIKERKRPQETEAHHMIGS